MLVQLSLENLLLFFGEENQFLLKEELLKRLAEARAVKMDDLKDPQKDEDRAKDPEWLVMVRCLYSFRMCAFK